MFTQFVPLYCSNCPFPAPVTTTSLNDPTEDEERLVKYPATP